MYLKLIFIYISLKYDVYHLHLNALSRTGLPLGIKIVNSFRLRQLYEKRKILSRKSWMKMEHGLRTKMVLFRFFSSEFCKRFKRDPNVNISQSIPLSRDISNSDNEWPTREVTKGEVWQAAIRIGLLTLGLNGMHVVFYQKCWSIIDKTYLLYN